MAVKPNLGTRVGVGVYRNNQGQLINSAGGRIARPGQVNQTNPANRGVQTNRTGTTTTTTGNTTPNNNAVQASTYNDPTRVKGRIAWLTKNRPNDPEIKRLNSWLTQYGTQPAQPTQPVTAANPVEEAPATPSPAPAEEDQGFDFNSYQSPMTKALMDAMSKGMSTMQAYEPQFFEGSPLYQFQKQKGMADLEKLMASRGLTGSGAEIQGNSDFLANINATEAEKQRQYAESNRDRQQAAMQFIANFDQNERDGLRDQWNKDLDRRTNLQRFEATRQDERQQQAANFLTNLLQMQSSNDIARLSQGGMNSQTDLTKMLMSAMVNNTMAQVPRGGGGGGGTPPPPQANNSTALMEILTRYGDRAGNNDVFDGILRLFSGEK
jgi:hypothetical protein